MQSQLEQIADVANEREVSVIAARLAKEFGPAFCERELHRAIRDHFADFNEARIRDFVEVFVERRVRADLAGQGRTAARRAGVMH